MRRAIENLVATIGDARCFKNGRQLAAWMGLVPRQHSSGGKPVLLGISKRGDCYLRTLLVHGARAVIRHAEHKVEHASTGPQLLPAWNPNAGGIAAFYFRDPDGNHLDLFAPLPEQ